MSTFRVHTARDYRRRLWPFCARSRAAEGTREACEAGVRESAHAPARVRAQPGKQNSGRQAHRRWIEQGRVSLLFREAGVTLSAHALFPRLAVQEADVAPQDGRQPGSQGVHLCPLGPKGTRQPRAGRLSDRGRGGQECSRQGRRSVEVSGIAVPALPSRRVAYAHCDASMTARMG